VLAEATRGPAAWLDQRLEALEVALGAVVQRAKGGVVYR